MNHSKHLRRTLKRLAKDTWLVFTLASLFTAIVVLGELDHPGFAWLALLLTTTLHPPLK